LYCQYHRGWRHRKCMPSRLRLLVRLRRGATVIPCGLRALQVRRKQIQRVRHSKEERYRCLRAHMLGSWCATQLATRCGMCCACRQASKIYKYQTALGKTSMAATKRSRRQIFALGSPSHTVCVVDVTSRLSRDVCHTQKRVCTYIYGTFLQTSHKYTTLARSEKRSLGVAVHLAIA
jgi:hypothetical protein